MKLSAHLTPVARSGTASRAVLIVVAVITAIAAPATANARSGAPGAPRRDRAHVAVIGGQPAPPGTLPWMAYIVDRHGNKVTACSGTIVAPNLVLTAGHCAENMQTGAVNEASGYQVTTGNVNWAASETETQVSDVSRVLPCPCLDRRTTIGDVALLQLSTPTAAPPITLASLPQSGTGAIFAGWGDTHYNQDSQDQRLEWAQTVLQRPQWCEREAPAFSPASEVCTIDPPDRRTGACYGDSGGPLLVPEPSAVGGMVEIGVASHVYGDCATTSPTVFTRVDAVSAWVKGWKQALATSPPVSASLSGDPVAAPMLGGVASIRSVTLANGGISLVLSCGAEGGVCAGDTTATITVREEVVAARSGGRAVSTQTHNVTLASLDFATPPGTSTSVRANLSSQNRTLLSRLGDVPLDVMLSGRGFVQCMVTLEPSRPRS